MAVTCAVVQGTCRDSGDTPGTRDYTVADFGTPDAAIVFFNLAHAGENPKTTIHYSVGLLDDTNQACCAIHCTDDQGTTITDRGHSSSIVAGFWNGAAWAAKGAGSLIANGIQINWTTVPGQNYYITVYLLKGLSNTHVGAESLTTTGVNDITAPTFKPHLVYTLSIGQHTAPESEATHAIMSFGAAHNNSGDTVSQGQVAFGSQHDVGATVCTSVCRDDSCCGQVHAGAQSWKGSAESFDSNGFSINTGADDPNGDYLFYLAIQLDSANDAYVDVVDTQTSPTTKDYTLAGWQPLGLILGMTNAQAVNTPEADSDAGSFALGMADGTNQYSLGLADEDAADTTDNQSDANLTNVAQLYFDDGASTSHVAALDSWLSTGFKLDYSDADGTARKWFAIAIKDTATAGGNAPTGTIYGPLGGPLCGPI